jgi:hypothetical protein
LRFDRMSGLTGEQLDELEEYVAELLEKPWDSRTGRPREMTLREALIVASGYARNNITEEIWATIASTYSTTAACLPTASFYSARPERGKISEPSGRCGFSGSLRYVSPTGGTGRDVRPCSGCSGSGFSKPPAPTSPVSGRNTATAAAPGWTGTQPPAASTGSPGPPEPRPPPQLHPRRLHGLRHLTLSASPGSRLRETLYIAE